MTALGIGLRRGRPIANRLLRTLKRLDGSARHWVRWPRPKAPSGRQPTGRHHEGPRTRIPERSWVNAHSRVLDTGPLGGTQPVAGFPPLCADRHAQRETRMSTGPAQTPENCLLFAAFANCVTRQGNEKGPLLPLCSAICAFPCEPEIMVHVRHVHLASKLGDMSGAFTAGTPQFLHTRSRIPPLAVTSESPGS